MTGELRDVTGFRGEKIFELCLTEYRDFSKPLFRPGFLGDKWPAIDFYVELTSVRGKRLYFFAQVKSTSLPLSAKPTHLHISTKKRDIDRLLMIPGPTYLFGVHEPTSRVFVRSIHPGMPTGAVSSIATINELTANNLQMLHDEVKNYWASHDHKPRSSRFV